MEGTKYCFEVVQDDLKSYCDGLTPNSRGEYIVPTCPICRDELGITDNYKLYIKSDFSLGYCQRCKSKFFNLIKPEETYVEQYKIPTFNFKSITQFKVEKVDCDYYNYSKEFDQDCVNYLISRNKELGNLYKDLKFRFRKNKVIMPCFWDDELIYYQVRNCEKEKTFRSFFLPPSDYKPLWINPLNSSDNNTMCICEGIFGAIGAWLSFKGKVNTCSCFGSNITQYQLWLLSQKCFDKLYLYLDDIELNNHNKEVIRKSSFRPVSIYSVKSNYGDPEDDFNNKVNLNIMKYY